MKYFATLGMSKPSAEPSKRERNMTVPGNSSNAQPISSGNPVIRRRSVSGPVQRENGIPIPKTAYRHSREPSEDEPFFPMDSPSNSPSEVDPSSEEHVIPHHSRKVSHSKVQFLANS